jgi:hypothetical protein
MDPGPINVGIILIPSPADKVKVPTQNHRVLIRANFPSKLAQELVSTLVICWSVDQHEPPLLVGPPLEDMSAEIEGTLPPYSHLKGLIPET